MKQDETVQISNLTGDHLNDVVRIHLDGMGYTLNGRLGREHLAFLYRNMLEDPSCYVGVATLRNRPIGVISGTTDAQEFQARLLRKVPLRQGSGIFLKLLSNPQLIWLWWQGTRIAAPVQIESEEIKAVLTAIVVDPSGRGKGVGRALVEAFEGFLRRAGVLVYKLDTRIANESAASFYRVLGFLEFARRADSIVFVRRLG